MLVVIFAGGGFLFGLLVGRRWACIAAILVGVVVGLTEEAEISGALYGLLAGLLALAGIACGLALRRFVFARPVAR
jgi:drug/metabolite transporter (DMT)-like permease